MKSKKEKFFLDENIRAFESGATRSPLGDKLEYSGYLNPLVLKRFAQYMKKHQTDSAGNRRAANNWQAGIPVESLLDSQLRHQMDVWCHLQGFGNAAEEPLEEALCAVMFNTMALLLAEISAS